MQRSTKTPEEHLSSLPDRARADMVTLDSQVSEIMHGLERVVWEGKFWGGTDQQIIGYGDYTHTNRGGDVVSWFIVGLALQKNYISVYVNAVEDKKYLAEKYATKLGKVKVGKSSISFKKLEDVDLEALLELITKARDLMTSNPS